MGLSFERALADADLPIFPNGWRSDRQTDERAYWMFFGCRLRP